MSIGKDDAKQQQNIEPENFKEFVDNFASSEPLLYNLLRNNVSVLEYRKYKITISEKIKLPDDFVKLIKIASKNMYGNAWQIIISNDKIIKLDSLEEQDQKIMQQEINNFKQSNDFIAIKKIFPNAKISL